MIAVIVLKLAFSSVQSLSFNQDFLRGLANERLRQLQSGSQLSENWEIENLNLSPLSLELRSGRDERVSLRVQDSVTSISKAKIGRWLREFEAYGFDLEKHEIRTSREFVFWLKLRNPVTPSRISGARPANQNPEASGAVVASGFGDGKHLVQRVYVTKKATLIWTCSGPKTALCL